MTASPGPDIAVYPPVVSVLAPLSALALEALWPLGLLPQMGAPVILIPGVLVLLGAGWLAFAGERAFRSAGTPVDPHGSAVQLVRGGPYRLTRNPMYLGMVLLQLGLALSLSLDWALIGAPLLWALLHFGVVLREEAYLSQRFGAAYLDYLDQTRRWL